MNAVERLVLEMIGESVDSPDVFTDDSTGMAQIRDSINDAVEEIAIITGGYKAYYQIPLREYRAFYRLDFSGGDIAWITDVRLLTTQWRLEQTDLIKLGLYNPQWLDDNGDPRAYFPIGIGYIGLWPKPGSDSDILEVNAVIVPERYSADTDRLKVKNELEYAAGHYAVGEYYASRGDAQSAIRHHTDYARIVGIDTSFIFNAEYIPRLKSAKEPWPKATG